MAHRHELIQRAEKDYEVARQALVASSHPGTIEVVAALLVVAARLEALEDALIDGLPNAGEGR